MKPPESSRIVREAKSLRCASAGELAVGVPMPMLEREKEWRDDARSDCKMIVVV